MQSWNQITYNFLHKKTNLKKIKSMDKLTIAKNNFEKNYLCDQYQTWLKEAKEAFAFYDGKQYSDEEKGFLEANGQIPVVINKIKPKLDNIAALEIKSRSKIKFRARSLDKEDQIIGEALSDLAYFQQDKEDSSYKLSQIAHIARICGIGWHVFEPEEHEIKEYVGDPLTFVWDCNDTSSDLSNSDFICRSNWVGIEDAIGLFPEGKKALLELAIKEEKYIKNFIRQETPINNICYLDKEAGKILVIEYQYRKSCQYYEFINKEGKIITCLDLSYAKSHSKDSESIFPMSGYKIYSTYFTGDILLRDVEHKIQLDLKNGGFLYTPYLLQREMINYVPYGLVRAAIMPQKLYNKKSSKLIWLMSARQIIAEANVTSNWNFLLKQIAKPDGVILTEPGKINNLRIERNQSEIANHYNFLEQHDKEIQEALGIYNEAQGMETNATSEVAIRRRQLNSNNNHILSLDRLRAMKRVYGNKLLKLIRAVFTEQIAFEIIDDDNQVRKIHLNQNVSDKDGNVRILNDVRIGQYNLYIEEVPDNATQLDEAREKVFSLLKSGINLTPGTLELFGVPKSLKIYEEMLPK